MDAGKGSFGARCAGGAHDKTIINRTMLRFRPIAPKPATGGSLPENKNSCLTNTRAKRKYVRVGKNKRCEKRDKIRTKEELSKTMTLQLLPENTDNGKDSVARGSSLNIDSTIPIWLVNINNSMNTDVTDRMAMMPQRRVVESWVTVECLTETYMDGRGTGCTDIERIRNLEVDTCPGFISDGLNRVQWVNQAYKRMVGPQDNDGESPPEVVVRLVVKEELPILYPEFACRVRVQYTSQQQQQKNSQTMPCDVWRIDFVGLAWRLDVRAALSLGR
uniref:DUF7950 domain-containing protein n=1 Tax=Davidia involucrata TaxID=16924 RepID=A0A5B7ATU7_DAVIN